jgi:hypothetical protein
MNYEETHVETVPFLLISIQYYDASTIFKKAIFKLIDESLLAAYNFYIVIAAYNSYYTERQELLPLGK